MRRSASVRWRGDRVQLGPRGPRRRPLGPSPVRSRKPHHRRCPGERAARARREARGCEGGGGGGAAAGTEGSSARPLLGQSTAPGRWGPRALPALPRPALTAHRTTAFQASRLPRQQVAIPPHLHILQHRVGRSARNFHFKPRRGGKVWSPGLA